MAVREFTNAIQANPNYSNVYWYRGLSYENLGQYQTAINDYDKAIQLDPNEAQLYNNRAITYEKLGQDQNAINDYTKAIQLDPSNAKTYHNRGYSYSSLGQNQLAIADYTKAIQLDSDYALAYVNRGAEYHNQTPRQYQLAVADYTKAIQFDPDYALSYNNRGIAYRALGQPTLADADTTMACSLDSKYCSNNVVIPTPTPYPTPSMTQDCDYTLLIDQGFSSFAGKTIQFKIGSSWANETTVWVQGGAELLDLTSSTAMIPFGPYRAWPISLTVPSTRTTFLSQSVPPHVVLGTANATPGTPITAWIDGNQVAAANCS
jgi:Flp pilus assembly protein TadD